MPKKPCSLARMFRISSRKERLDPGSELGQELTFHIAAALLLEFSGIDIQCAEIVAFPAKLRSLPLYPLSEVDGATPHRELGRVVRIKGVFGCLSYDCPHFEEDTALPLPASVVKFKALCDLYHHAVSGRCTEWGWELGRLDLIASEDRWHEPITRSYRTENKLVESRYHARFLPEPLTT